MAKYKASAKQAKYASDLKEKLLWRLDGIERPAGQYVDSNGIGYAWNGPDQLTFEWDLWKARHYRGEERAMKAKALIAKIREKVNHLDPEDWRDAQKLIYTRGALNYISVASLIDGDDHGER